MMPTEWRIRVFLFQAEDGIRDVTVTGVQTCALPICRASHWRNRFRRVARRAKPGAPPLQRDRNRSRGLGQLHRRFLMPRATRAEDPVAWLESEAPRPPGRPRPPPSRLSPTDAF